MDVITLSSKGQLVVPRNIREEMGLEKEDKFVVVHDKNSILLKRILSGFLRVSLFLRLMTWRRY